MSGESTTRNPHAGMPDAILEHLAEGVSLIDADLNIVAFNRRFLELLDFPAERFRPGMPLEDFFRFNAERGEYGPGDVEAQVKERIDLARRFEPHEFERTRPDGTVLEIRGRPLPHGGFVTVYSDVTARKRSEVEEKTRERQLLAQTIEHMAEGFALFDASECLIVCNSRYRAMFPKIADELRPGVAFTELVKLVDARGQIVEINGRENHSFVDERLAAWRRGETLEYRTSEGRWIEARDNVTEDGQRICLRLDVTERKQAEAALLASGERYRALITSALDAVVTVDEEGRITHWNPQAENIFGWRVDEAVGRLLHEILIPERFRTAHLEGMEHFRKTGKSSISNRRLELSALRKSGEEFSVELTVIPLRRDEELAFSAFIRDITERVRVRGALNASEARFRDFANIASDWRWEMDEKLRFTFISDRFEELTGIPVEPMIGKSRDTSGIEDVSEERLKNHLADMAARRPFREFIHARRRPDGELVWVSVSGNPRFDEKGDFLGYRGVGRDITDQIEAEKQVESLARFHSENPNPVLRIAADGVIHSANTSSRALLEIWGVGVGNESPHDVKELVSKILAADTTQTLEVEGGENTFHLNLVPVADAGYVNVYGEDVTIQKKTEQKLRQIQKMEAVGQLTGGVAHDFNNRLTVMLGNLELLEDRLANDESALKLVKGARRAAEGGAKLTRQLLSFSRRQMLEPEIVDVSRLLHNLEDMFVRTLGETIDVQLRLEDDVWPVRTDMGQLEDAILNLAVNARDAMPNGGVLTLETANLDMRGEDSPSREYMVPGEYVLIALTDTGSGIPLELQERIFEPFFSTKTRGKGTGLGLAMVYGFVKQTKGYVNVYSEEGHGTCVKIYLPRHHYEVQEHARRTERPGTKGEEATASILVVEDDPGVREIAVTLLRDFGYRVLEAEDALQALEIVNQEEDIDLLFTDMVMPGGIGGMDLARQIRSRRPEIKVIFTSGYTEKGPFNGRMQKEKVHWLTKPYTRSKLAEKVRQALSND